MAELKLNDLILNHLREQGLSYGADIAASIQTKGFGNEVFKELDALAEKGKVIRWRLQRPENPEVAEIVNAYPEYIYSLPYL
jgi:hypothetical protein